MEEKIQKYNELMAQKEIAEKIEAIMETENASVQELLAVFADNGLNMKAEELAEVMNQLSSQEEELSEDSLEDVAGGCYINPRIGIYIAKKIYRFGARHGWW